MQALMAKAKVREQQLESRLNELETKKQRWANFHHQMAALSDELAATETALPKADSSLLPEERYHAIAVSVFYCV
jgi:hypothetical protein